MEVGIDGLIIAGFSLVWLGYVIGYMWGFERGISHEEKRKRRES